MIDLLVADDRRGFGVMAMLDIERIPYRRIARAEDFAADALLVAREAESRAVVELAARVPTLIVAPAPRLAHSLFQVGVGEAAGAVEVPLDAPVWPADVRAVTERFAVDRLRLPHLTVGVPEREPRGTVLASCVAGRVAGRPAVVEHGGCRWCLLDLGTAFTDLLDEAYWPEAPTRRLPPTLLRPLLALYYRAPEALQRQAHRRAYAAAERALRARAEAASSYPVDPTGWLLLELLKALLLRTAGRLVRLGRWPAPWTAAAVLTHDLEPTRFAYTAGLAGLLARSTGTPSVGVVSGPAARHLTPELWTRLGQMDVYCHGRDHRGETLAASAAATAGGIAGACAALEARIGRRVLGFRSPRLDRSPRLLAALDRLGLLYDSSYPDVDRENPAHFGGGVRLNLPFRPPILADAGGVRPSRCLELPVSAPDCIQPLFLGERPRDLARAVRAKCAFLRDTGALYVGIVHAGVFNPRDAARRGAHLRFVRRLLGEGGFWTTTASRVAEWWTAREQVEVRGRGDRIVVRNRSPRPIAGLQLLVETASGLETRALAPLAPGADLAVSVAGAQAAGEALA